MADNKSKIMSREEAGRKGGQNSNGGRRKSNND